MSIEIRTASQLHLLQRCEKLNEAHTNSSAQDVLRFALNDEFQGEVAIVSSFGAESAALLSLAAEIDTNVPIIFLNTLRHFDETLDYVETLCLVLGLTNVSLVEPRKVELEIEDPKLQLSKLDSDKCCHIRKTLPMIRALNPYKAWITGRKRYQNSERQSLNYFEHQDRWIKINPLANWDARTVQEYMADKNLPPHPLVEDGYPSIGCQPCTTPVAPGETDARAGRWRGSSKEECGIHIIDGKIVRQTSDQI